MQTRTFKAAQTQVDIDTPGRRIGKQVIEITNLSKAFNESPLDPQLYL